MTSIGRWLLALTAIGQVATSLPPAFPRPNATKLVETDRIVVWDIVWPKDQPSPLHRHVFDQVGTYYQSGGRAITSLNGARSEATTPVGNISTTRKGSTHVEEGTTDPPLRAVFIEMKFDTAANPSTERSVAPPRTGARQVHSEDRVTVWDSTWSAGTPAATRYERDTVIVWLTIGAFRVSGNARDAAVASVQPGSVWYRPRGTVETEELIGGSPRAMIFEFR